MRQPIPIESNHGRFFIFVLRFFYKCRTQIRDASIRLKERYPNVLIGIYGLSVLILPTAIHILIVNNLNLLAYVIQFLGGDASFVSTLLNKVLFSSTCGWILFASKVSGALIMLLAVVRSSLQKRPKNGYMPLSNPHKSNQDRIVERRAGDGA